ncbi:hypothetical protein [Bacillus cereus]|uniref:hypothetical protein n=1 Tax=Bacillus cereus TaxID=1396 RepID=UPI000BF69D67|nr:hypothetical protein [Bacillus cereus]PFR51032.1 hypothetical protein COK35_07650 [Bacillus cereus]
MYFRQNNKFSSFKNAKENHFTKHIPYLREISIIPEIATIFKDFFFDKFFKIKTIWKMIYGEPVNKLIMHENFHEENHEMSVCPFCDISLIISNTSSEWDHFLPQSIFPLLSMNPYNLFSICGPCNIDKGNRIISPIFSPATFQVGKYVTFKMQKFGIDVQNPKNIKEVQSFIDLLKLKDKYQEKKAVKHLLKELDINIEIFQRIRAEKSEIEKYLTIGYRHKSMSLAVESILKTYPIYQNAL